MTPLMTIAMNQVGRTELFVQYLESFTSQENSETFLVEKEGVLSTDSALAKELML